MAVGPIVGGVGLLLLTQVNAGADYVTGVLPGVTVFGLGLAATVAPLTATALDSVEEHNVGVASGINNGVARVAGLLAIAVVGAVIAGSFESTIDDELASASLSPRAERSVEDAKEKPLGSARTAGLDTAEADEVTAAATTASERGFHLGMALSGVLLIVGGGVAAIGIQNPGARGRRSTPASEPSRPRGPIASRR
jgi:hypothetical protein